MVPSRVVHGGQEGLPVGASEVDCLLCVHTWEGERGEGGIREGRGNNEGKEI